MFPSLLTFNSGYYRTRYMLLILYRPETTGCVFCISGIRTIFRRRSGYNPYRLLEPELETQVYKSKIIILTWSLYWLVIHLFNYFITSLIFIHHSFLCDDYIILLWFEIKLYVKCTENGGIESYHIYHIECLWQVQDLSTAKT